MIGALRLGFVLILCCFGVAVLHGGPAAAAKRPPAIQMPPMMIPVKMPNGDIRKAEVTVYAVIPDVNFIEAACAYRMTINNTILRDMNGRPMTLEQWGKLELGSQDIRLSQLVNAALKKEWIVQIHAVAGTRARPKYTPWTERVRTLKCSDWERWKTRKPPPPPPIFNEPLFRQFRE